MKPLVTIFNAEAGDALPATYFCDYIQELFGRETALKVTGVLEKMGVPMPQDRGEFVEGNEGALLFLNKSGIVIRIEGAKTREGHLLADRVDDSGWIVQPLASIAAGKVIVEVCPGIHLNDDAGYVSQLITELMKQGIAFWDHGTHNIGFLPVKTPHFSEGIPVVIDRLAVKRLTESTLPIATALKEVEGVQDQLYAPLRRAFRDGWERRQKMARFWNLCGNYVRTGKLIAGWNELPQLGKTSMNTVKLFAAIDAARVYALKTEWRELKRSGASAVPQSPRRPA